MTASATHTGALLATGARARSVLMEGIASGLLGALAVALWFFLRDLLEGQPLHTPGALGQSLAALLEGRAARAAAPGDSFPGSLVFIYSVVHGLAFVAAGIGGALVLDFGRRNPGWELYAVLFLATLGMWFTFLGMMLVGVIFEAVTIVDILIAHLLAALAMGAYFWRRHPEVIGGV
ncbi:MAG: hypothetical protein HYZ11_16680 [Candidatus Tectomicrobia bacterium]|uniref:Uncharacterized protein n=1 Tax=Tectimicrobiota bacterium TaxID=2528274 RepID=A0A932I3J6_UNCTE|nr:hypothetical protein [Candidatus Tectomicrobia bacterium]